MGAVLRVELRKAFGSRWFWATLVFAIGCALMAAFDAVSAYQSSFPFRREDEYPFPSAQSCFAAWLGVGSWGVRGAHYLFYYLVVFLAPVSYAWSGAAEMFSGYIREVVTRCPVSMYLTSKVLAVFLSAGVVATVPLLINLALVACVFPAYLPDAYDVLYTGVYEDVLFAELFYTQPFLFVAARVAVVFFLCGLWSCAVFGIGLYVDNRVIVLVVPYLVLLAVEYFNHNFFGALGNVGGVEFSLFNLLQTVGLAHTHYLPVVGIECLLLAALAAILVSVRSRKDIL